MSKEPTIRTIKDEYGELEQRINSRGEWSDISRTINDITFYLDKRRKTKDYLLALKAQGIYLRKNTMNDRTEVWNGLCSLPEYPEYMTDTLETLLVNWMLDIGLTGRERIQDAITEAAWQKKYHPIIEYLSGLRWDGKNHFDDLCTCLKLSAETDVFGQAFLKRWLIGSIAKIIDRSQNFMLVIDGKQGIGKSSLSRWLCPMPKFFIESAIHPDDKDCHIRLISNWIWEVGELEGTTRKADRAALKDFISRKEVTIRLPYGRQDLVKPACASLVGTINEDGAGFLNDPTGSRRFAVMKIEKIDFSYCKIDIHQLWAQVYQWYKNGESCELQEDEKMAQATVNGKYEADSPVEQYLHKLYEWDKEASNQQKNFISSIEILGTLALAGLKGIERANMMEISTILKREGLVKDRVNGVTGFYGITKRPQT